MSESRTEKTFKNAGMNIVCQIATLITNFVTRTLFIKFLGADYLGINGLFGNILTMLSLSELGFSTAIVYNLYKYLAKKDEKKIAAYINYYGHIYKIVFLVVLGLGLALLPFLKYIIKFDSSNSIAMTEIKIYYVLFLIQSAISYLFVYKSCIIGADQRSYIVTGWTTGFNIFASILQIVFLCFTHKYFPFISYFVFLLIRILTTLWNNIFVTCIAQKQYPYINNKTARITKEEKKDLIDNVKNLFVSKIGETLFHFTDNILISVLVSTTVVGYYSNYVLLTGIVTTFANLLFGGLNASVGNYINLNSKKETTECFYMINFAQFWIFGLISLSLLFVLDDFINLWVGKEYVLGFSFTLILIFNIFVANTFNSVWLFCQVAGMFKQMKYIAIISCMFKLGFSVWFGKLWGLHGIIFASIFARFCFSFWFYPYTLFKLYLSEPLKKYYLKTCIYYFIELIFIVLFYFIKKLFLISNWLGFLSETICIVILINLILFILFNKSVYFKMVKDRVFIIIKR